MQTIRLLPLWLHTTPAFTPLVQPCWQGRRGQCFLSLCRITFHRAAARLAATTHCGYCNVAEREREKKKRRTSEKQLEADQRESLPLCVRFFFLLSTVEFIIQGCSPTPPLSTSVYKLAHFNEHAVSIYDVYFYGSRHPVCSGAPGYTSTGSLF